MTDRDFSVVGGLTALVIAAVVVVFLAAPGGSTTTTVIATIIGIPAVVFSGLAFLTSRNNAKQLNGAMDRHLENAKEIGQTAARAAISDDELRQVVIDAVRDAGREAVNQVMRAAQSEERAARAARTKKRA